MGRLLLLTEGNGCGEPRVRYRVALSKRNVERLPVFPQNEIVAFGLTISFFVQQG